MTTRRWLLGRTGLLTLAVVSGVLLALWFLRPAPVSVAQQSAPVSTVDPRWLAVLQAERPSLEGTATLDGAAAAALTLNVLVQDGSVAGVAPTGAQVTASVVRDGTQIASGTMYPALTESGWFYSWTWLFLGEYANLGFKAGDVVSVAQGGQTLSLTVSSFQIEADAGTEHVAGTTAANAGLNLHGISALDSSQVFTASTTADMAGLFDFDLSATVDLLAGDFGYIRHPLDATRSETARFVVPRLQVQVGGDEIGGSVAPFQAVTVRVISGTTVVAVVAAMGDATGSFSVCIARCPQVTPRQLLLLPGQQVVLTAGNQTLTMTVPVLTTRTDRALGRVAGVAEPGAVVRVMRWPGPVAYYDPLSTLVLDAGIAVTASASGDYTAAVPLQDADFGAAVVRDADGNLAYARFAVPQLRIVMGQRNMGNALISGQIDRISRPVTVTIVGPSGLPKAEIQSRTTSGGWLQVAAGYPFVSQEGLMLSGQDVISITEAGGVVTVVPLQPITVTADVPTQRISGRGPISATLPVHLYTSDSYPIWPMGYDTVVFSDLAGFFGIDLVDYRIKASTLGTISWKSPDGHVLSQSFTPGQTCLPDVSEVVVGGNSLTYQSFVGEGSTCSPNFAIRLYSDSGSLKHTRDTYFFGATMPLTLVDDQGAPIRIEPGDTLSLLNGTQELTMPVPIITATIDLAAQRISGRAPAGSTVSLTGDTGLKDMRFAVASPWTAQVTADSNGAFQFQTSIEPGDRIEASLRNRLGTRFTAIAVAPAIELELFGNQLLATLPPLTPITLTLQTSRPVTPTIYANMTDDRGRINATSFAYPAWLPWSPQSGDRVVVQAGAYQRDWLIPELTAEAKVDAWQVQGTAPVGQRLVLHWINEYIPVISVSAQSDGGGHFAVDLPTGIYPETPLKVVLFSDSGDRLSLQSGSMYWQVRLGSACLQIRTPRFITSGTLKLSDAQGHVRATQNLGGFQQTYWSVCLNDGTTAVAPRAGDRLDLVAESGSWNFALPVLSVSHDPRRGIVTGAAPTGGVATIALPMQSFDSYFIKDGRTVTVDSSGRFGVDVSDRTWHPGQQALLRYTDRAGNVIEQVFTLTGIQHWLPIIWHP